MNERLESEDPMSTELRARIESVGEPLSVVREVEGGFAVGHLAPAAFPVGDINRMRRPSVAPRLNRRARRAQASQERRRG